MPRTRPPALIAERIVDTNRLMGARGKTGDAVLHYRFNVRLVMRLIIGVAVHVPAIFDALIGVDNDNTAGASVELFSSDTQNAGKNDGNIETVGFGLPQHVID